METTIPGGLEGLRARPTRSLKGYARSILIPGTAVILGSGVAAAVSLGLFSSPAGSDVSQTQSQQTQSQLPAPGSSGDSPAPTIASWSGTIPITQTGGYSWSSNTVTVTAMPSSFAFNYRIEGGTAAISDLTITPVAAGNIQTPTAAGAPTNAPTQVDVSFTVDSFTGSPVFDLVQAEAEG